MASAAPAILGTTGRAVAYGSTPRANFALIGGGTSALTASQHLLSLPLRRTGKSFDTNTVVVRGPGDVWARFPERFPMGQMGALYKSDVALHKAADYEPYMRAGAYVKEQQLNWRDQPAQFLAESVRSVKKYGRNDFLITTSTGFEFAANYVVVATGAGPERSPSSFLSVSNQPKGARRPVPEVINGTDFMMKGLSARGGVVAIYGGAPTSAWAAGVAAVNRNQVVWIANDEFGGFASANPAGRNSEIIRRNRDNMFLGRPEELIYRSLSNPLDMTDGGLVLRLRNLRPDGETGGKDTELVVSQFVYAIGTDGRMPFLDSQIYQDLCPVYDSHCSFSASELDTALGLLSGDEDLIVVGAAAQKGLSSKGHSSAWERMALTLPEPARPYAGIAMINASIEALANHIALHNPNLFVANRQQLAAGLESISHTATEKNRLEVADRIIQVRTSNPGATEGDLVKVIKDGLGAGGL